MGLDSVGLMSAVEDAFGFSIPDEDAVELETLGELYNYVLAHRIHGKQQTCLNSITFYKIRRAMMSVLQLSKKDMQASTDLSAIISQHRRRVWRLLQEKSGLRFPLLRRPIWVVRLACAATIGLAIATPLFLSLSLFRGAILTAILTAVAVGYALLRLTTLLEYEFQPGCSTVGELTTGTLARNFRAIVAEFNRFSTDAEVWQTLCLVVAGQLGVPTSDLTRETKVAEDLGVARDDRPLLLPGVLIDSQNVVPAGIYS